jgi:hypothetical protein
LWAQSGGSGDDKKPDEDLPDKVGGKRLAGAEVDAGTSRMQQLISLVEGREGEEGSLRKKAKTEVDSDGDEQVRGAWGGGGCAG